MAIQTQALKLQSENLTLEFPMLSRLVVGETVISAVVTSTVYIGIDPTSSSMISTLPILSGSVVNQLVVGGLPGVIYNISCAVRTSLNNIVINVAKLAVMPDDAATPP